MQHRQHNIDGVVVVHRFDGASSRADKPAELVVEIPHGATQTRHFEALRARLTGPFPADLVDFFHVNTDVGAPEVGLQLAAQYVQAHSDHSVEVLVCQIPRTFIDTNRVIDDTTRPTTSTATGMTPGVVQYVREASDLALLIDLAKQYQQACATALLPTLSSGGRAIMLHTYAPRSVDVVVDEQIVQRLHDAYTAEQYEQWPLRAPVDVITTTPEGEQFGDPAWIARLQQAASDDDLTMAVSGAYGLHPSTAAYVWATRFIGQTLCVELRRDLLVEQFTPFAQMQTNEKAVERFAAVLLRSLSTAMHP